MDKKDQIRDQILSLVKEFYQASYGQEKEFIPGQTFVNYGGRCFDDVEMVHLVSSSLDFWLTEGGWVRRFEHEFANWLGVKHCLLTNSGSSANLLAISALTAPELGERRLRKGDEVITIAAGFPTTVFPIIQCGAIPVFIDVNIPSYNIDVNLLEGAISDKTKAVIAAHTLGNPFNLTEVKAFCDRHDLWLIEDNCDALGSTYYMDGQWIKTGTVGHLGTSSFYPPHHMTMGEGGAVYTNDPLLNRLVDSYRSWGRDCWCASGVDNTCKSRFSKRFGDLPAGYDHKYVYSHFGYNLKVTEMQAAIGCAQLEKLDDFTISRRRNWQILREGLHSVPGLIFPEREKDSDPSWFGFLMTVEQDAPFTRNEISGFLESKKIQTRNLFAGNLVKHPVFNEMRNDGTGYRVAGNLINTDLIMNNSFWVGVYPGMTLEMLEYMVQSIKDFVLSGH